MAKNKKSQNDMMDRKSFQNKENYPVKENGLPEDRFQNEVQTSVASQTNTGAKNFINNGEGNTGGDSIVARTATSVKKKVSIKPTSDTELEPSKIVGGVPLGDSAATMSVAGAPASEIPNDQSRVPYTNGGFRSNERYGKKISADNFVVNNVVSEQINPIFDEPKDLRENPNATQGYNGRKQFKTARGKKVYGDHPGATLYERSIDFVGHSAVVHTTGQVIGDVPKGSNYPVDLADPLFVNVTKGNYLLNAFEVTVSNGHITKIAFDETRVHVPDAGSAQDQANFNWQTDANNVAKAMVKMQTELGRETTDKWSPLGYVIKQPYEFGMLFHDGEAILGSLTGAAYKTAAHSLAYLQNKMAKEGVRNIGSIAEWMGEDIALASNSAVYDAITRDQLFSSELFRQGFASAIIDMFDSNRKYTSKADFINQPRSLKFHLQTIDNNINPFHAKKEFYKALDKTMLFSTDDGQYNPVLPIHTTDEVKIMTPYSLNAWLQGWKNPYIETQVQAEGHGCFFRETGLVKGCKYEYSDIRNKYAWEYVDPFVAGLCRWLLRHESAFVKTFGNGTTRMPIHVTNTTANLFSYIVCSASQDMAWMRNIIFRDYLFAGDQGVYVWEDLSSLSDLNPVYASQYKYTDYATALQLGRISDVSKIRIYWPEIIMPRTAYYGDSSLVGTPENRETTAYYLPFYFNENAIDNKEASGIDASTGANMSYPIIRGGVNHEYVDLLYSMTERDVRLCLDRMVTVPAFTEYNAGTKVVEGTLIGDRLHYSALRYDRNSDGRVIISMDSGSPYQQFGDMTYLATPRELGFIFPLPASVSKNFRSDCGLNSNTKVVNQLITGAVAEYITSYHASGSVQSGSVVDRAASLTQEWIRCFADPACLESNNAFVAQTGIVPAISCIYKLEFNETGNRIDSSITLDDSNLFTANAIYELRGDNLEPVTNIDKTASYLGCNYVFSMARMIWSMLQRRYAPINAFECAWAGLPAVDGDSVQEIGIVTDPLEMATYFGFAGTFASDFNQDVLDRLSKKDELGMFYFEDEFIKSSLIFS